MKDQTSDLGNVGWKANFERMYLMMRRIALAVALALPLGTMATAQAYDWRTALSQSVEVQMEINEEYEFSKERVVPIHFSMGVPFLEGALITRTRFPSGQGNLGEMQFLSPNEQLLEYVTVSVGTVGGDTLEERLQRVFSVIEGQVYPSLTPPQTANILGARRADIAGHPAVEFVSLFDDPAQGSVAARIVGLIAPNETDVIFVVQQTIRDRMGLIGPDELANTFAGAMLSSLTFQAYRDASGALLEF